MTILSRHREVVRAKRRSIYRGAGSITQASQILSENGTWLSASRGHAFASSVTSWTDQAGSSQVTFTAPGAAPAYLAGPPATINFNGSTQFLQAPSVAKMTPSNQFYWFSWMVDPSTQQRNFWSQWDNDNELWYFGRGATGYDIFLSESPLAFGSITFPVLPDSNLHFVEIVYNGLLAAANRLRYFVDRVEQVSTGSSGTIPATLQEATPIAYIAAYQGVARKSLAANQIGMDLVIPSDADRDLLYTLEAPV